MKVLFLMKEYKVGLQIYFPKEYSDIKEEISLMLKDFYDEFLSNKINGDPAMYVIERLSETYNIWSMWEIVPMV